MNQQMLGEWYPILKDELDKEYFNRLRDRLRDEYTNTRCYPPPNDIFKVFQLCPPDKVRVVMLSQDPYPSQHAHGIAFSSNQRDTPYSLQIILREVDRDVVKTNNRDEFKKAFPTNDLTAWVKQGVFLLNVNLTVRAGQPMSHNHLGWPEFTNQVLINLLMDRRPKVFVTLGKEADTSLRHALGIVSALEDEDHHEVIRVGHPASGAHGKDMYSGCNMFSKINRFFSQQGLPGIDWRLTNEAN